MDDVRTANGLMVMKDKKITPLQLLETGLVIDVERIDTAMPKGRAPTARPW